MPHMHHADEGVTLVSLGLAKHLHPSFENQVEEFIDTRSTNFYNIRRYLILGRSHYRRVLMTVLCHILYIIQ